MGMLKLYKTFKVAVPKITHKRINDGIKRISNKIVKGTVFQDENGVYKISIIIDNDSVNPDLRVLEFTERSYDLKGRTDVFSREVDKKGRRTRYIRNETNAKYHPGLPEQYIPFAPNWDVRGYIVNDHGIHKFDFKSLIGVHGYKQEILHPEDD